MKLQSPKINITSPKINLMKKLKRKTSSSKNSVNSKTGNTSNKSSITLISIDSDDCDSVFNSTDDYATNIINLKKVTESKHLRDYFKTVIEEKYNSNACSLIYYKILYLINEYDDIEDKNEENKIINEINEIILKKKENPLPVFSYYLDNKRDIDRSNIETLKESIEDQLTNVKEFMTLIKLYV